MNIPNPFKKKEVLCIVLVQGDKFEFPDCLHYDVNGVLHITNKNRQEVAVFQEYTVCYYTD